MRSTISCGHAVEAGGLPIVVEVDDVTGAITGVSIWIVVEVVVGTVVEDVVVDTFSGITVGGWEQLA
jgi:hypothetical protein